MERPTGCRLLATLAPSLVLAGLASLAGGTWASEEGLDLDCVGDGCGAEGAHFVQLQARRLQGAHRVEAASSSQAAEPVDTELRRKRTFQQHFSDVVADEATTACRIGSIEGCLCADGTNGTYCCMDGKLKNGGSTGGEPVEGTVWQWLRRDGTVWHCTGENGCPEKEVSTFQKGASPPFMPSGRGADILHAPRGATCDSPRVLFVHGGGWNSGAPNEIGYFTTGSRLARDVGAVVMAIDYPLARTCYRQERGACAREEQADAEAMVAWTVKALEYLFKQVPHIPGTQIPVSGCNNEAAVIIGGDSSGGGTALSALLSTAPNGPVSLNGEKSQLAGAFLWSGFYDLQCTSPSYVETAYAAIPKFGSNWTGGEPSDWWHTGATDGADTATSHSGWAHTPSGYAYDNCRVFAVNYAGSAANTENPYYSLTKATPGMLQGLPPIIMHVDGSYGLVGEAHVVAQNAAWADVRNEVYLDVYPGLIHDFEMYSEGCGSGMPLWQGQMAWKRTAKFIKAVAASKAAPPHVPQAPCHERMSQGTPVTTYHLTQPLEEPGATGGQWGANSEGDFGRDC